MSLEKQKYLSGFGNHHESEAVSGALPIGQNSPQVSPLQLVPEQLSGSAFTMKRHENLRSWLYKIRPSVVHGKFEPIEQKQWLSAPNSACKVLPNQTRWDPIPFPSSPKDWVESLVTVALNGSCDDQAGSAIHIYHAGQGMGDRAFFNADGELLLVPEQGGLTLTTEFGVIEAEPLEVVVIPRGVKFKVDPTNGQARGYVLENYGMPLQLPNLGPIGANGLANPRDFLAPVASFEDKNAAFSLVTKTSGQFFEAPLKHSPFDVVAWHGNYFPYKYNLSHFNTIGSISFDHPDPSIFTVLTSPTDHEGLANVDFVIFPPRWLVANKTFRPPYYHRNIMSEYMGLIHGEYDAKISGGFLPGGGSLHNCMAAHGPDAETFEKASASTLEPQYLDRTMAFMFESSRKYQLSPFATQCPELQGDYQDCWQGIQTGFKLPT